MTSRGDGSGVDGVREPRRRPARMPDRPGCAPNAGEASVHDALVAAAVALATVAILGVLAFLVAP